jgi:hypothetical protein
MFVHDFVVVEREADEVVQELARLDGDTLAALVQVAWAADRDGWAELGWHVPTLGSMTPPDVRFGPFEERGDAIVFPIEWQRDEGAQHYPDIDIRLEVYPFPMCETHLHLIGSYIVKDAPDAWTCERSLHHRAATLAIRRFLTLLVEMLETGYSMVTLTPPSAPLR